MQPESLKELIEGKFVDALRSVAAGMTMSQLHEQRADFVQKVQQVSAADLAMNGLELESVSLTGLDQTSIEHFNANNAFDAEGLTKLTEQIELRKKARNDIEQETRVQIETKNLEAEQRSLDHRPRDRVRAARAGARRRGAPRRADGRSRAGAVARASARPRRRKINAKQQVDSAQIEADRVGRAGPDRAGAGDRDRPAGAADRGPEQEPRGKPGQGRGRHGARRGGRRRGAGRHRARDRGRRARQADRADRGGQGGRAPGDRRQGPGRCREAGGRRPRRGGPRGGRRARPRPRSCAPTPSRVRFEVEAAGQRAINEAANLLSSEQISLQTKLALLKVLPELVREAAKPMEAIDSIKIVQVDGLTGGGVGRRRRRRGRRRQSRLQRGRRGSALPRAGADRRRADEGAGLRRRDAGQSRRRRRCRSRRRRRRRRPRRRPPAPAEMPLARAKPKEQAGGVSSAASA